MSAKDKTQSGEKNDEKEPKEEPEKKVESKSTRSKKKTLDQLLPSLKINGEEDREKCNADLKDRVDKLVSEEFPKRLVSLSVLYKTPSFSDLKAQNNGRIADLKDLSPEASAGEKTTSDCRYQSNPFIEAMFDDIRPHIQQLFQDVIAIRMVMNLRIADLDIDPLTLLGQTLQMQLAAVVNMLARIETYCNEIIGTWADYHGKRAKIIEQFNPKVGDHLRAVVDLDDQMMASLCFSLGHLISFYISLEDAINETNAMMAKDT